MLENWDNAIVTDIQLATYVAPNTGKTVHHNRPFHGFVLNDATADKVIHFSDGNTIHTGPYEVHYLPKGASYRVEHVVSGGCWAINFDLLEEIREKPFSVKFRIHEPLVKIFKDALSAWNAKKDIVARNGIYDIILKMQKEQYRSYMPSQKEQLIQPAVDRIHRDFTKNELAVRDLARLCGISEAYFRRIFMDKFSVTPKEYIIHLRTEYAKRLLESGQFGVGEIAQMCGYFEPCHFSREFKKRFDLSPAEYAKASRN